MAHSFTVRNTAFAGLACALMLCVVACGDAAAPSQPVANAAATAGMTSDGARVAIQTFRFQPPALEVAAGTTVTWTNGDDILHTVTTGAPGAVDGRFNGTLDGRDTVYQFTLSEPGTNAYFCSRHESMRGEVRVP